MENFYRSLIIEDVPDTSDYILQRLRKLCPVLNLIDQAYTLEDAYLKIRNGNYNLIFLDIQLPGGTGFDLLQKLAGENTIEFEIIFITGEGAKEYVISAIKYSAIDYLYKPLDDAELISAVSKAIEKINRQKYNQQVNLLLDRILPLKTKSNKIAFYLHGGIIELIEIPEIKYLRADGVISYIFLRNGQQISTTKNLGFYKEMLITDYNFIMISNSLLVNLDFFKRYNHRDLSVVLTDGTVLFASKRFGKVLKEQFQGNFSGKSNRKFLSGFSFFNKSN